MPPRSDALAAEGSIQASRSWAVDYFAADFKPRSVAGAVPRAVGFVPAHKAAHMTADCRNSVNATLFVLEGGHFRRRILPCLPDSHRLFFLRSREGHQATSWVRQ
jgi:hypothetical protein